MDKGEKLVGRIIKIVFVLCSVGIMLFFAWGQFNYPRETDERNTHFSEYDQGWYQVKEDGTKEAVSVPGEYDVGSANTLIVTNTLPKEVDDDDWICFRTAKQDVEVYVGDELRKTYSTEGKRPFGTSSVSMYIFVDLEPEDAGKTITYKAWTVDDSRAGVMRMVHYGDKFAIWSHLILVGGAETILTFFMLLVGFVSVIIIGFINIRYKKNIEVEYLCWGVLLISVWLITQSDVRQLFFPNVSIANSMTYFTIMLAPIPFLIYIDDVQEHRYRKLHMTASIVALVNFVFCTVVQLFGLRDLMDMSLLIFLGIGIAFAIVVATFFMDWRKGHIKKYRIVAVGFGGAIVAAGIQMIGFYNKGKVSTATMIALGVLFLLLMATIRAITDVIKLERQKQDAIIATESKARFLASISHEIRTPINAVLGMDEMILRESRESNITEYAMDIRTAGKSLLSLVNDVLDMSKIESGKMEIIPKEYDVYKLMDSCYNLVALAAEEKKLELEVANDETIPKTLYGDEVRIRQIITNLLTNAVKYTKKGKITFKLGFRELDDQSIVLSVMVSDTGIGISKESQEVLFDAFERFDDNNTRHIEGTGLGLNIVKQLVELMNGTISVHSEYGNGSVFTVFIPQKVESYEPMGVYEPEQIAEITEYEYKEMFMAPGAEVLVVDDVDMNIRVFSGLLKSTCVNIDSAENGPTCLELVKKKKYDIIFLDHLMPGMDGVEVMKQMRLMTDNVNADTPVIMLTANAVTGAREEYVKQGFADYITKPLKHVELENIMLKYLPRNKLFGDSQELKTIGNSNIIEVSHLEPDKCVSLDEFDFLDVNAGLSYCCNDEAFYIQMIKMFVEGDKLSVIKELYDRDDWRNYRLQIHSLKGTALTIGAKEFSQYALEIESALKQEDYLFVHKHHKELIERYEELLGKIKSVFEK